MRTLLAALAAVALAPSAAHAAILPVDGSYAGHDHITRPVDFTLHGTNLTNFRLRGTVILHNAHVSHGAFNTSQNGVHITGHWTSDHTASGTITSGGSTARWTVHHQRPAFHPYSGTYAGHDGLGHTIHLSYSNGYARDFTSAGTSMFVYSRVTGHHFSSDHNHVQIVGTWEHEHSVGGTITYNGHKTTWSAHAYSTR